MYGHGMYLHGHAGNFHVCMIKIFYKKFSAVSTPLVNIFCSGVKDTAKKLSAGVKDTAKKFVAVSLTPVKIF